MTHLTNVQGASPLEIVDATVETQHEPVGLDTTTPRFSWRSWITPNVASEVYNRSQSAYQILVASSQELLDSDQGDLWDSGKVDSDASLFVPYAGEALKSLQTYYYKVRIWDEQDQASKWSQSYHWVQGIMSQDDWQAQWIATPADTRPDVDLSGASWIAAAQERETDGGFATEFFRKSFVLDVPEDDIVQQNLMATLYYAACQKFELFVNGQRVGFSIGMVFNPDQLRSIDISEYIKAGKNVVAIVVSNDTKRPNGTKFGDGSLYPTALVAKVEVKRLDKTNVPGNLSTPNRYGKPVEEVLAVGTDSTWKSSIEGGENWNSVDFDDSNWAQARYQSFVQLNNNAPTAESLDLGPWGKLRRRTETLSPAFHKEFEVGENVKSAMLAVCAPGLFEFYVDGEKFGDQLLTPSMTRYDRRLLYNVFDLTETFQGDAKGSHELQFILGHSWYDVRSIVTWNFDAAPWRDFPRLLAQLVITYQDGSVKTIATDDTWDYTTSPIVFDCVRQGEIVNGSWVREILGRAEIVPAPLGEPKMTAQKVRPTKATDSYEATAVKEVEPGVWVVDMGRNCAGWARIRLAGQHEGDVVRFRYSERVLEDGKIERHDIDQHFMEGTPAYLTGMKGQFQTDFYFCSGAQEEFFEPRFTYNGYQYIEVTGLREAPKPTDFVGMRLNTDFDQVGEFETSNELLNKLQNAMAESYRNNFVAGYPTDCPHREKNGWTGDAQLACELAQYNFENTLGYEKWIDDLCDEQRPDGNLPGIVPSGDWGYPWGNGPAWDSALVLIPWYVYLYRGDRKILEDAYDHMKLYVDYLTSRELANGLVNHGLGDWVTPKTSTPTEVTSTGYYFVDAKIVAQTAKLLGKDEDYQKYSELAKKISESYNRELYKGDGVYSIGSQTSQSCAFHQGFAQMLPEEEQVKVFNKLVEAIERENGRFDAGILGVKYILRTLSEHGRTDLALQLMLQEERPAMSDWIHRGAGTLWEDWGEGSSRNHIMFGDFSAWYFQSLCGIKLAGAPDVVSANFEPDAVAFKKIVIAPKCRKSEITAPGHDPIKSVGGVFNSPYGLIATTWKWDDDMTTLQLMVMIPPNTTAKIYVPCEENQKILPEVGGDYLDDGERVDDAVLYNVGSGFYVFDVR
ncbi:MAG: family 78 glycoside hydrolase catalytic domain [Planctomycetia bacterium]|nr:family 78 glycoside hydrolase catalytic domain [Planctomycetia bacterium]